jgi:hypothetical protein
MVNAYNDAISIGNGTASRESSLSRKLLYRAVQVL